MVCWENNANLEAMYSDLCTRMCIRIADISLRIDPGFQRGKRHSFLASVATVGFLFKVVCLSRGAVTTLCTTSVPLFQIDPGTREPIGMAGHSKWTRTNCD